MLCGGGVNLGRLSDALWRGNGLLNGANVPVENGNISSTFQVQMEGADAERIAHEVEQNKYRFISQTDILPRIWWLCAR